MINSENRTWHKDCYSCCDSMPLFFLSFCCPVVGPAITQYFAHKDLPNTNIHLTLLLALGCCCFGNCINRVRMRQKLKIPGLVVTECLFYTCCCYSCMVMQEYQEVNLQVLNKVVKKPLN